MYVEFIPVLVHPWLSVHGSYRCLGQDDPCEGTTTPTPITTTSGLTRLCPDGWEDGGLGHCYIFLDHRDNFENAKNMWVSGLMIDMMLPCECGALSDDCDKRYKHDFTGVLRRMQLLLTSLKTFLKTNWYQIFHNRSLWMKWITVNYEGWNGPWMNKMKMYKRLDDVSWNGKKWLMMDELDENG